MIRMRVLFVDDEPRILDGIRRMLRSEREEWDLAFCAGGEAAIEAMIAQPFDVVVSDMRMPGMDGIELLSEVRRRSPKAVRIVLSGHADRASAIQGVGVAHQYLAKPCEPDRLRSAIRRAVSLRRLLNSERLLTTIARIERLPALPRLYQRLVAELQSPTSSMDSVARIIGADASMAADVLKLSNSTLFGPTTAVNGVERAVQVLGLETVAMLVLRVEVLRTFDDSVLSPQLFAAIGDHSLRATRAARIIARLERVERGVRDDAITGALLSDIGLLALAANLPEYAEILARHREQGGSIARHEADLLGTTHAEVGAYLLGLWGLPDGLVEAVAHHGTPGAVADRATIDAVTIVAAANVMAHLLGPGPFDPELDVRPELGFEDRWPAWEEACRAELTSEAV